MKHSIKTINQEIKKFPILHWLVFLAGPWVSLWMVEILNQNDIFEDLHAWQILFNLIWYYLVYLVLRLLTGRMRTAASSAAIIFFIIGMVNHYILRFRGRILFPADLAGWMTAANVADGYDLSFDHYIVQALVLLIAYLFLVWIVPRQKKRKNLRIWVSALLILASAGYSYAFFGTDMLPRLGIYTQQWVTQGNGFVLNFTVALRYSSVDKPPEYSRDYAEELLLEFPASQTDVETTPTNIIVIMSEALADFSVFESFDPSTDPMPFYHSLTENTTKGTMYAPVTGGGTASTEFEYLTGFSTYFQPPHTVGYQLYVNDGMPSLGHTARESGYDTTSFHPYKSSGWNRPIAYDHLSFNNQYYDVDVKDPIKIRNYISEQAGYDMIIDLVDESEGGDFVFNVSMQNHGGYAQGWNNLPKTVTLSDELNEADGNAEQYFSLVYQSDLALQNLLTHYESVDEPTMVVLFGDHQPALTNLFYEELIGKSLSDRTTEEVMTQYAVPFLIWTNYDTPEVEDLVISPNFLGALTAQIAGLPMTNYMNFLMELHEVLPAITPVGCVTADGSFRGVWELSNEEAQWIRNYEALNYAGMVDLTDDLRPYYRID